MGDEEMPDANGAIQVLGSCEYLRRIFDDPGDALSNL